MSPIQGISVDDLAVMLAVQGDIDFPESRADMLQRFGELKPETQVAYKLRARRLVRTWGRFA